MTKPGGDVRNRELKEAHALVTVANERGLEVPPDLDYELYLQECYARGINPWTTFREYVEYLNPTLFRFEHTEKLVEAGQALVDGEIMNLLVLMPTRYLKTEFFGRLLPGYFLRKNPQQLAGICSYNADKAWETSDWARDYFRRSGGQLDPAREAKRFWGPPEGGEVWAVGMGSGTLGRGFNLGVVDDPIDPEKLRSSVFQRKFQEWWSTKWVNRQQPKARKVVVMQRLGTEDPIDYLLRREVGERTQKAEAYWHVLVMDEVKSDEPLGRWKGERGLPPTCTVLPDKRKVGDLLAPTLFDADEVEKLHREGGPVVTAAQRQQRPMRPTGDFWQQKWFTAYDELPAHAYNGGRDWDTAYSKDEANSATANIESYRGPGDAQSFPIFIHKVHWDWLEFPALVELMNELSGPHYIEAKATGKSAVQALLAQGVVAAEIPVRGDKFARASAVQRVASTGRVYVHKLEYDRLLFGEGQGLLRVTAEALMTNSEGLDVNDVFVQVLHRHLGLYGNKKKVVAFR